MKFLAAERGLEFFLAAGKWRGSREVTIKTATLNNFRDADKGGGALHLLFEI